MNVDIYTNKKNNFNAINLARSYKGYVFERKNRVIEYIFGLNSVNKDIKTINDSKLIIFRMQDIDTELLLKKLYFFDILRNHLSPVVRVEGAELLYFPKLYYDDVFLLKYIFESVFYGCRVDFMLGRNRI